MNRKNTLTRFILDELRLTRAALLGLITASSAIHAQTVEEMWPHCGPYESPQFSLTVPPDLGPEDVYIETDELESREQRFYRLEGNARLWRSNQWLEADHATYDHATGDVQAHGAIRLGALNLSATGDQLQFNFPAFRGELRQAQYWVPERHARGTTDKLHIESDTVVRMENALYTTCPPDKQHWYLRSPSVKLDRASGFGTATNAYVAFYDVPIVYVPWVSFPITAARKTGFLMPSFGYSDSLGAELTTPYYINLAPNYDATLTPRIMGHRGTLVEGQLRYLTDNSEGEVNIGYMPNDDDYDDKRMSASLYHEGTHGPYLSSTLDVGYVSDDDYLDDFGNNLTASATQFITQQFNLNARRGRSTAALTAQSHQVIDPDIDSTDYPYRLLPQLTFGHTETLAGRLLEFDIQGEFVNFDHKVHTAVQRTDITPTLQVSYRRPAGFFVPKISLRHTHYDKTLEADGDDAPASRTIPVSSLDTGLFFERDVRGTDTDYLQTLEPRVYYVYAPYEDQSDLPVFDSSELRFTFAQMFRDTRFSGADRVGDANQLTLALTSRLIENATGLERLWGSVGQIQYFEDRDVTLPGSAPRTTTRSELAAEVGGRLAKNWRARASALWDPYGHTFTQSNVRIQYKSDSDSIFNAGYRKQGPDTEQTDYSFIWPIGPRWKGIGRWYYAHQEKRTLEVIAGLEYDSCCWRVRLVNRRYLRDADGNLEGHLMVQLELKGLSSVGESIDDFMAETIPGFPRKEERQTTP